MFFGYVSTVYLMIIFVFSISLIQLISVSQHNSGNNNNNNNNNSNSNSSSFDDFLLVVGSHSVTVLLCVACGILFLSVSGLFWFHVWLISKNLTTHEHVYPIFLLVLLFIMFYCYSYGAVDYVFDFH